MMVVDAVWAPYSSTGIFNNFKLISEDKKVLIFSEHCYYSCLLVFACATMDKVQVYDLNVDKLNKLAEQKIVKQPKLTNLSFNYKDPILLVGDSHGGVTLVKLSPNLCKCKKIRNFIWSIGNIL